MARIGSLKVRQSRLMAWHIAQVQMSNYFKIFQKPNRSRLTSVKYICSSWLGNLNWAELNKPFRINARISSYTPTVKNGIEKPPSLNKKLPMIGPISMPRPVNVCSKPFNFAIFFSGNAVISRLLAKNTWRLYLQLEFRQPFPNPSRNLQHILQAANHCGS